MAHYAIIPAAGAGRRMGGSVSKQFMELQGKAILCHTLERFEASELVSGVIVVVPSEQVAMVAELVADFPKVISIVAGGKERQDSVYNALEALPDDAEVVAVHDGVRPFVRASQIDEAIRAAMTHGGAIVAVKVPDTIKREKNGTGEIAETIDRTHLWLAQTPQAFRVDLLKEAFLEAMKAQFYGTDEAGLVERIGRPVYLVMGDRGNVKITTPDDLPMGEAILAMRQQEK